MKKGIHILHLEDDPEDASLIEEKLKAEKIDCTIKLVQTQNEFENALKDNSIDLVLADYNLPGYDGLKALKFSKKFYTEIPFIFVSGTLGEEAAIEGLTQGATDYVLKQALIRLAPAVKRAISERKMLQEQKKAEEALRISEERFSKVFRLSPIASAIINVKTKRLVDVNDIFTNTTGYNRDEIIGQTLLKLHLYEDPNDHKRIQDILEKNGTLKNFEFKIRNKEGKIGIGLNTTIKVELAGEEHYLTLIQDITEQKHAENELRKLSRAVEQSPASIIITDIEGNIEYVNSKFTEVTGYNREEVLGKNPRILKSDDVPQKAYIELWQTITSGEKWSGELKNKKKSGEFYWELASISPIFNSAGEIINFLAVKEDITRRKQAEKDLLIAKEKAEESDRLKTAFLQNISHEIRTPMNAICGFSELLSDPEITDEKRKEFISIINDSSNHLLTIVSDILTISSLETKQEKLNIKKVSVNDVIFDLATLYKLRAKEQNIQLLFKQELSNDQSEIYTDQTKLIQILSNLISNAIKFSREGSVKFGYQLKTIENNDMLEFYVKDTGIGIKKEMQEIIFDRFTQADDNIRFNFGGTGLGLSISKGMVELLGGKIWVNSEPQKGSTFYFTIPYNPV